MREWTRPRNSCAARRVETMRSGRAAPPGSSCGRAAAVRALESGVLGDPQALRGIRGRGLASFREILDDMPASIQERWFARCYLLMPIMVATLAAFWIASGIIGVMDIERAARTIPSRIMPLGLASVLVVVGSMVDVGLGIAILFRPLARLACAGMATVASLYLVVGR